MKELVEAHDICSAHQKEQKEEYPPKCCIHAREFLMEMTKKDLEQIRTGIFMFYPQEVFDCRPNPRKKIEDEVKAKEWTKYAYQLVINVLRSIGIKNFTPTSEERQIWHIMIEMLDEGWCPPSAVAKEIESRRTAPTTIV